MPILGFYFSLAALKLGYFKTYFEYDKKIDLFRHNRIQCSGESFNFQVCRASLVTRKAKTLGVLTSKSYSVVGLLCCVFGGFLSSYELKH